MIRQWSTPLLKSCTRTMSRYNNQAISMGNTKRTLSTLNFNSRQMPLTRFVQLSSVRKFTSSSVSLHGGKGKPKPGTGIKVDVYDSSDNFIKTVEGNEGDDLVDLSWEWDIDIEAACEKSLACSTCHVILDPKVYDSLEEPSDEENDMLDLAFGLTDTSRLGCQVHLSKDMDGMKLKLPSATRNMAVDGYKPTHH